MGMRELETKESPASEDTAAHGNADNVLDGLVQPPRSPSFNEIQLRAFELYLEGGCLQGRDFDDWLQAERELLEKFQRD
jgi:hypothetical protein